MHPRTMLFLLLFSLLLVACGGSATPSTAIATLDPVLTQGQEVFRIHCAACHATQADMTLVGPSLAGIASQAALRVEGQDAQTYLSNAILRPSEYIVTGYQNLMPNTFGKTLSGEDFDALILYLLTLE